MFNFFFTNVEGVSLLFRGVVIGSTLMYVRMGCFELCHLIRRESNIQFTLPGVPIPDHFYNQSSIRCLRRISQLISIIIPDRSRLGMHLFLKSSALPRILMSIDFLAVEI